MKIVEPDPEALDDEAYGTSQEDFAGRRPVLYHEPSQTVYLGHPDWYHGDAYDHHGLDAFSCKDGFVGGGPLWGNGKLSWYTDPPLAHQAISEALEKAIPGITAPRDPHAPGWVDNDEDWMDDENDISGLHHPRP